MEQSIATLVPLTSARRSRIRCDDCVPMFAGWSPPPRLYTQHRANVCQIGKRADMCECFNMVTRRPAKVMRLDDYGLAVGKSADLMVLDLASPEMAVAELTPVLYAFKRGHKTVSRQPAMLQRPQ
jgi:formylmethanofuran dehydrogenase subunit A